MRRVGDNGCCTVAKPKSSKGPLQLVMRNQTAAITGRLHACESVPGRLEGGHGQVDAQGLRRRPPCSRRPRMILSFLPRASGRILSISQTRRPHLYCEVRSNSALQQLSNSATQQHNIPISHPTSHLHKHQGPFFSHIFLSETGLALRPITSAAAAAGHILHTTKARQLTPAPSVTKEVLLF